MLKKSVFLYTVIFIVFSTSISGDPLYRYIDPRGTPIIDQLFSMIDEFVIPLPDVQYELPEELIGEFIMVSHAFDHVIRITPNNKFISLTYVPSHVNYFTESYGYIVKKNNKWFLSPIPARFRGYIDELTEISLTNSGFSYYLNETWLLTSMRKEKIPIPIKLEKEINISNRISKQKYFIFNNLAISRIDFGEIETPINNYHMSFRLRIDNGIVRINTLGLPDNISELGGLGPELFEGFIEKTEENTNGFKGVIKFINGPSYYYIKDGIAEIEINNDGVIIITMFYSPRPKTLERTKIPNGAQFPAKLILEF